MDLASQVAIALPAGSSIQDAVDAANGPRPELRDVVGCLLLAMRLAKEHASSSVVWPRSSGTAPAAPEASGVFQLPKAVRLKPNPSQRSGRASSQGSSEGESGWSSAGALRHPPEPSSSS